MSEREIITDFDDVADHEDGSVHEWWDADDDEEAWHCRVCGVTVYPETDRGGHLDDQ